MGNGSSFISLKRTNDFKGLRKDVDVAIRGTEEYVVGAGTDAAYIALLDEELVGPYHSPE